MSPKTRARADGHRLIVLSVKEDQERLASLCMCPFRAKGLANGLPHGFEHRYKRYGRGPEEVVEG